MISAGAPKLWCSTIFPRQAAMVADEILSPANKQSSASMASGRWLTSGDELLAEAASVRGFFLPNPDLETPPKKNPSKSGWTMVRTASIDGRQRSDSEWRSDAGDDETHHDPAPLATHQIRRMASHSSAPTDNSRSVDGSGRRS
ncbi:hypothetical protein ACLOJK_040647 [Asimina triloba]